MAVVTLLSTVFAIIGATGATSQEVQLARSGDTWVVQTRATLIAATTTSAGAQSLPTRSSTTLNHWESLSMDETDGTARSGDGAAVVMPTSFEAADHASVAELARLRQWWEHNSESTVVESTVGEQTPAVVASLQQMQYSLDELHTDNGISVFSAHHFRGGEEARLFISDSETIAAVAVTVSMPGARSSDEVVHQASSFPSNSPTLMPTVNTWVHQAQQDAVMDEVLGSLWHLSNQQAVLLDGCNHAEEANSLTADDEQEVLVEPAHFTLGLEGFSAWALGAYMSVISVLFLVTLMWLTYLLLRAVLHMLWKTLFHRSASGSLAPVYAKHAGKDLHYEVVDVNCDSERVTVPLLST